MTKTARTAALGIGLSSVLVGCSSGPGAGEAAPAFSAMDSEGRDVALADYEGRVTVLDFWATWCGPCRKAMPSVQALHERYADNPEVAVVGVHFDANYRAANPADYFEKNGYTFDLIPDGRAVSEAYGVSSIPTFIVIDREGTIVHRQTGFGEGDVDRFASIIDAELEAGEG